MLKLNAISKTYRNPDNSLVEAIRGISVQIKEGEFAAFVGKSGCGKTTILKIVAGLLSPSSGHVIFNGEEVRTPSKERGMVFQHFTLFPWLTVYENIAFGLRLRNIPEEKVKYVVNHYLALTGLDQFKNHFPKTLSGGMQQRVAIARTLANDPKILLLDEPFGSLDAITRSQMQELLEKMWEEERKTVLFVTHDIEEAIFLADRVFLLSERPATIREELNVDFPRPRTSELKFTEKFFRLKATIARLLL